MNMGFCWHRPNFIFIQSFNYVNENHWSFCEKLNKNDKINIKHGRLNRRDKQNSWGLPTIMGYDS